MHNPLRGENSPVAKLTQKQAQEILQRNLSGERHQALAQEFGVSPDSIGKLVRGLRWKEIEGKRRGESRREGTGNHLAKLNEAKVREIRAAREQGVTYQRLAERYEVHPGTILAIIQRRTWKQVL